MKKYLFALLFACAFIPAVSAQPEAILSNPQEHYSSLGTLEVKVPNRHGVVKYLTLGIVRNREYKDMQDKLDKMLVKEARKKYKADAVINVAYWPAPDSGAISDFLYARGEMIRFKKFTLPEASAAQVPE